MFQYLYLSIAKALYGEFSEKYFFLVDEYKKKYPQLYVSINKCFKTNEKLKFEGVIIKKLCIPVYKTSESIQIEHLEFGTHIKDIIRLKGRINCANYLKIGEGTIKIIGYHEKMLNSSVRLSFFVLNGIFFLGEYHFYKYDKTRNISIANTFRKKYGINETDDELNFYIEDEQGSNLYFRDDGFSLSIKYFNTAYCSSFDQLQNLILGKVAGNQTESRKTLKQI